MPASLIVISFAVSYERRATSYEQAFAGSWLMAATCNSLQYQL